MEGFSSSSSSEAAAAPGGGVAFGAMSFSSDSSDASFEAPPSPEPEAEPKGRKAIPVGPEFQAVVPPIGGRERGAPRPHPGDRQWRPQSDPLLRAGMGAFLARVLRENNTPPHEQARVKEHVLQVLHSWNYDLEAVARDWDKICRLRPVPPTGPAHWNRADTFALEQILRWYPKEWKIVAEGALTNHTLPEIEERFHYLRGGRHNYGRRIRPEMRGIDAMDQRVAGLVEMSSKRRKMEESRSRIQEHNQGVATQAVKDPGFPTGFHFSNSL